MDYQELRFNSQQVVPIWKRISKRTWQSEDLWRTISADVFLPTWRVTASVASPHEMTSAGDVVTRLHIAHHTCQSGRQEHACQQIGCSEPHGEDTDPRGAEDDTNSDGRKYTTSGMNDFSQDNGGLAREL